MTNAVRLSLTIISSVLLGVVFTYGMIELPAAGARIQMYGYLLTDLAVMERHAVNTVSGVLFDLRALDTLGEMLVIFTASAGINVLLRMIQNETELKAPKQTRGNRSLVPVSDAIRTVGFSMVTATALYGVYLTVRGHLTVGGGFQGGVVIASAFILLYLSGRYKVQKAAGHEDTLDVVDSIGVGGYIVTGLAGLALAGAFLANILPLGQMGNLISSGMVPILSILVGLEAFAAVTTIVKEMQEQQHERGGEYDRTG